MKIGGKLILGFLIVAPFGAAVGVFGIVSMKRIGKVDTFLFENNTVPLEQLVEIYGSTNRMRSDVYVMLNIPDPKTIETYIGKLTARKGTIKKAEGIYVAAFPDENDRKLFAEYPASQEAYQETANEVIGIIQQGKYATGPSRWACGSPGRSRRAISGMTWRIAS